jgi:hypothetical protein
MCGRRFLSALAFFCSSLIAGAPGIAGGDKLADSALDPVALEAGLARDPALYLVLDPDAGTLSVRCRGVELETVTCAAIDVVWDDRTAPEGPPLPDGPAVWTVRDAPPASWRRVVAPAELQPFDDDADPSRAPSPTPAAPRPEIFTVGTDSGWSVVVGPRDGATLPIGPVAATTRGWRRLFGPQDDPVPPTLWLVLDPQAARDLVHLFRPGVRLLVVRGGAPAPSAGGVHGTPTGTSGGSSAGSSG